MSPSLNQVFSNTKARPILSISIVLLVIVISGCLLSSKQSEEKLINRLNSQLREEKFEQLYEEASDFLHLNVTKEKFVDRMKVAVGKLKTIDENLSFQRDWAAERSEEFIRGDEESVLITAFQKLEKDGKSVLVCFNWTDEGKLVNLWIMPNPGTSKEYQVFGVSHKHLYRGNQMIE